MADKDLFADIAPKGGLFDDIPADPVEPASGPSSPPPIPDLVPFPITARKSSLPFLSWKNVLEQAYQNAPSSALQAGKDLVEPVIHPIDTAESIGKLGLGLIQKLVPGTQADEASADALGEWIINRYGGMDEFKHTLAKDPVGLLADASMVLSGGGTAVARAPGVVGKIGKAVQKAGATIDPLSLAGQGVKKTTKQVVEPLASHLVGDLGTHTGADSLRAAARAGAAGGEKATRFLDNLRAGVPLETVVEDARSALAKLRIEKSAQYRAGMKGVAADETVLDFSPIDKALKDVSDVGTFKGKPIYKSTAETWKRISDVVYEWRKSDPTEFHTAEGLDALKKAVGDIRDTSEVGSPSYKVANDVYNAVWSQIVAQAPDYAKVMRDYEQASKLIVDLEKTFSLGRTASVDTTLRKLQSIFRNNANTNYGRRVELAEALRRAGAPHLMEQLGGQALNTMTPRGLGRLMGAASIGGGFVSNPWLYGALPLMSPRLMGETAYYGGKAYGVGRGVAEQLGPTKARAAARASYLSGRYERDRSSR